eukprot:TRINITY_DN1360_c0_g1_i1.p1 TRINITY_DN1360_c0_g1~~TRINITY_DN1360_c0_g1_i1.p1  ORF type:complete len:296 (-),score=114.87 TRINITY_DN1360_c0_g1_i1:50-937(-)
MGCLHSSEKKDKSSSKSKKQEKDVKPTEVTEKKEEKTQKVEEAEAKPAKEEKKEPKGKDTEPKDTKAKEPKAKEPEAKEPKAEAKDTKAKDTKAKEPKAEAKDSKPKDTKAKEPKAEAKDAKAKEPKAKEPEAKENKDETASQETDRLYKKYMAEVDGHAKQRQAYFDEASKAHDAGDGAKAKEMSNKGKEESKLMEAALIKAGYLIYEGKNTGNAKNIMDLHGLQVKQAELIVSELLEACKKEGFATAEVIHGKGNHSGPEGPKLKGNIRKMVTDKGYKWKEGETEGSIIVELK